MRKLQIAHLEDNPDDAFLVERTLAKHGIEAEITAVSNPDKFIAALSRGELDFILVDGGLPGFAGRAAMAAARRHCPTVPLIVVSGCSDEGQAMNSLSSGASDYVLKDHLWQLPIAIRRWRKLAEAEERTARFDKPNREIRPSTETAEELEVFSDWVSHDLREPLRAIDGILTALAEDYQAQLDATGQSYIERARAGAARLTELIDGLLRLSRFGSVGLETSKVNLGAMAREIMERHKSVAPERRVELVVEGDLEVEGDPNLLGALMENLLSNAWKYTSKREMARITVGASLQPDGESACFVKDNGAGFDTRRAERIFTPFQRFHREEDFPGTGIGLSIAQRIVHRHGGRIWAEAAPGEGATFFFTLRVDAPVLAGQATPAHGGEV
jgi:signal transduction histidine kinase